MDRESRLTLGDDPSVSVARMSPVGASRAVLGPGPGLPGREVLYVHNGPIYRARSIGFMVYISTLPCVASIWLWATKANLQRVYRTFDVFYFPSVTEGQPNARIEAILAKVPFVASDIPGIQEMVPSSDHAARVPTMAVEPAAEAILAQLRLRGDETQVAFAWTLNRFGLARNMKLSLQTLWPVQEPHA